jgi:hypothetical protein
MLIFNHFFLLSYNFLQFDEFFFQDTYNNRLKERYMDDPLTHPYLDPDLWLEAGSSSGPDRNRVYELSNTTTENLQMTHSVSTIGCLQLVLSTQTLEFKVMLDQQVHDQTTHLNKKYKRLTSDYQELCQVVMEMRSNMSDL